MKKTHLISVIFIFTLNITNASPSFILPHQITRRQKTHKIRPSPTIIHHTSSKSSSSSSVHATPTSPQNDSIATNHHHLSHRDNYRIIGILGGIGSGKSQACRLLVSEWGCVEHVDADALAHSVYDDDDGDGTAAAAVIGDIREAFGDGVVVDDGGMMTIDRKALGGIVFSDGRAMGKLERIVWPHVKHKLIARLSQIENEIISHPSPPSSSSLPIIVVEAAVLLDAGWDDMFDATWIVRASTPIAIERLTSHRGMTEDDAKTRITAQQSRRGIGNGDEEMRNGVVTAVVENDGTVDDLKRLLGETLRNERSWKTGRGARL